jgi:hypothetical protein
VCLIFTEADTFNIDCDILYIWIYTFSFSLLQFAALMGTMNLNIPLDGLTEVHDDVNFDWQIAFLFPDVQINSGVLKSQSEKKKIFHCFFLNFLLYQ